MQGKVNTWLNKGGARETSSDGMVKVESAMSVTGRTPWFPLGGEGGAQACKQAARMGAASRARRINKQDRKKQWKFMAQARGHEACGRPVGQMGRPVTGPRRRRCRVTPGDLCGALQMLQSAAMSR